ncbi:hypothetical protein D3C80_914300 [compost metagenome]
MAADSDPVAVRDAQSHHGVDRRLGAGRQLLDVGVVRLGPVLADDGHGRVVQDGIALGQQEQVADAGRAHEAVVGVHHLTGHGGVGELGRIGPHHQRQRAVAILVVTGGQIECARQLDPVVAGIGDELALHVGQLRGRVGELSQLRHAAVEVAQAQIGRIGAALAIGDQLAPRVVHNTDDGFILALSRAPDTFRRAGLQVQGVEEGIFALTRRAVALDENLGAVGGEADDRTPARIGFEDHRAGIIVAVLIVAIDQDAARAGVRRIDQGAGLVAGVEPAAVDDGGVVAAPLHAGIAFLQVHQGARTVVERRGQHEDAVAHLGGVARIAAVLGFDPDQGGVGVGAPLGRARAGGHGVERRRHVVAQRQVGHAVRLTPVQVGDDDIRREQAGGHDVGIGFLDPRLQDVTAIRRHRGVQEDARLADSACAAVQRHHGQLTGEIVLVQSLVARVGQQVLIGAHRGRTAASFFHGRPHRRTGHVGGGATTGGHGLHQQTRGVGQPAVTRSGDGVDARSRQTARLGRSHVGGPQLQTGRGVQQEGHRLAIRRPADAGQAGVCRQTGDGTGGSALDGLEAEACQPGHTAVGRAVVLRIEAVPGQTQHGLGQFGDARQAGTVLQQKGPTVRTQACERVGLGVQNLRDRLRRLLIGGRCADSLSRGGLRQGRHGGQNDKRRQGGSQDRVAHGFFPETSP